MAGEKKKYGNPMDRGERGLYQIRPRPNSGKERMHSETHLVNGHPIEVSYNKEVELSEDMVQHLRNVKSSHWHNPDLAQLERSGGRPQGEYQRTPGKLVQEDAYEIIRVA